MSWQTDIPPVVRTLIDDWSDEPVYSDDRLMQMILVAAKYVQLDVTLPTTYTIDISKLSMSPDPFDTKDDIFIGLVSLKSACLVDQSTLRTKAATEGIRASLGPANITVQNSMVGIKILLESGPCGLYQELKTNWNIRDASYIQAVLSPFVGNKFNPRYLQNHDYRSRYFYS